MKNLIIQLSAPGGPERLEVRQGTEEPLKRGEIRLRQEVIGLNFVDIYHRKGVYTLPAYPAVLGLEAAGTIEEMAADVTGFHIGERVAYAGLPVGAYRTMRTIAADRVVKLPDTLCSRTAASSLLKVMTAYMLLHKTVAVSAGHCLLIHAAAGGLGSLLVKWGKALGATVIGTVSTEEKAKIARFHGADHVIVGRDQPDLADQIKGLTGGQGADIVYDGIGGSMLARSLQCVRPFGLVASIGRTAGTIPPVSLEALRPGKMLSHPSIVAWGADTIRYQETAQAAIKAMADGMVSTVAAEYPLRDAAQAHAVLESGKLSGSIILIP